LQLKSEIKKVKLKELPKSFFRAFILRRKSTVDVSGRKATVPCVISLTSIPSRLQTVDLVIRSLLRQSCLAEKIILWLNLSLEGQLPRQLAELQSDRFEIRFRDGASSHRKLVFSLLELSNKTLVTCDDDLMYDQTWLERLYADHQLYPQAIIAHECRSITVLNKKLLDYQQWPTVRRNNFSHPSLLPIGYGGVLYPNGALYDDVTNQDLYMRLAPKADDLWFKAMGYLKGTMVRRSSDSGRKPLPIIGAKGSSLAKTNILQDGNRIQWQAICDHYSFSPSCSDSLKAEHSSNPGNGERNDDES